MKITITTAQIIAGDVLVSPVGSQVVLKVGPSWLDGCLDVHLTGHRYPRSLELGEPITVDRPLAPEERASVRTVIGNALASGDDPWQGEGQHLSDAAKELLDLAHVMDTGHACSDHDAYCSQLLAEWDLNWHLNHEKREAAELGFTLEQYAAFSAFPLNPYSELWNAWFTCAQTFVNFLSTATADLYPDDRSFRRAGMLRAEREAEWALADMEREKRWRLAAVLSRRAARVL